MFMATMCIVNQYPLRLFLACNAKSLGKISSIPDIMMSPRFFMNGKTPAPRHILQACSHFPTAPTSYYAYTTKIMSEISKILELEEEHQKYAELYEKTKAAVSETNVQYHYFFGSTKLQTKYIKEINSKL